MWKIGGLKRGGRKSVRGNYWRCLLVSLVVLALAGSYSYTLVDEVGRVSNIDRRGTSNAGIVDELAHGFFAENTAFWDFFGQVSDSTNGLLGTLFNSATQAGSFLFGALNAVNQFVFKGAFSQGIIVAVGAVLFFFYWLFVRLILRVGELRFYLENRRYPESRLGRLFFIYQIRRTRHVAFVMFCRWLLTALLFLTIVGGVVALYAWRMVPYLMAENPDLTRKQAFAISARMMRGQKWRAFLLDLSFLGWYLLDWVTLGLLGIFWLTPYKVATDCELYIALRETALESIPDAGKVFSDRWLTTAPRGRYAPEGGMAAAAGENATPGQYPVEAFPIPVRESRRWIGADYHRRYTFTDVVLLFFAFCLIGYIYEVIFYLIGSGVLINRGTMYGPWLPIYGTGGVAILILLRRWRDKPVRSFFLIMLVCGVVEYVGGWYVETFHHTKWWDYTGYFLNIQGRVCLESLLAFGIMGMLGIYFIAPSLADLFAKIPRKVRYALCIVLGAAFIADFAYSQFHPNVAGGEPVDEAAAGNLPQGAKPGGGGSSA